MHRTIIGAAAALLLAGCSEDAPQQQKQQSRSLEPGQYELSWTVSQLRSTDKSSPATSLSQGETGTASGCIREGGDVDPALFAEAGDQCTPSNSFVRAGRVSVQMECKRPGQPGLVMQSVNAKSAGDSFEGELSTSTYLDGSGDYEMTRTITARRAGECAAGGGAEQSS